MDFPFVINIKILIDLPLVTNVKIAIEDLPWPDFKKHDKKSASLTCPQRKISLQMSWPIFNIKLITELP